MKQKLQNNTIIIDDNEKKNKIKNKMFYSKENSGLVMNIKLPKRTYQKHHIIYL